MQSAKNIGFCSRTKLYNILENKLAWIQYNDEVKVVNETKLSSNNIIYVNEDKIFVKVKSVEISYKFMTRLTYKKTVEKNV